MMFGKRRCDRSQRSGAGRPRLLIAWIFCVAIVGGAFAQGGDLLLPDQSERARSQWDATPYTVVVYNLNVPESVEIALEYQRARNIPAENLVGLSCSVEESITPEVFEDEIRAPLRAAFTERGWWTGATGEFAGSPAQGSRMRVICLIHGVPLAVRPSEGKQDGHQAAVTASVDSELMLLGAESPVRESGLNNPYFDLDMRFRDVPFAGLFVVGRIDGRTPEVARRIIKDSLEAEREGLWGMGYVDIAEDGRPGYVEGDKWLRNARARLLADGVPVVTDEEPGRFPTNYPMGEPILYLGWYTTHCDGPFLNPRFQFAKGAVATHIHSYSAVSLRRKDMNWTGPLLDRGAAASLGNVAEPFLSLTTHVDVFVDRLLKGYTLVEAAWMATPAVSWMNVVVGDPLYRPFAKRGLDSSGVGEDEADASVSYRAYYAASKAWGMDEPERFLEELAAAGERTESGVLLECAGLLCLDLGRVAPAQGLFRRAATLYGESGDVVSQLRTQMHVIDILRSGGAKGDAIVALRAALASAPEIPETEALKAVLLTLDPPPPGR